jgi:hypothetical protein
MPGQLTADIMSTGRITGLVARAMQRLQYKRNYASLVRSAASFFAVQEPANHGPLQQVPICPYLDAYPTESGGNLRSRTEPLY